MKKAATTLIIILLLTAGYLGWVLIGSGTGFSEKMQSFEIPEGQTGKAVVLVALEQKDIIKNSFLFSLLFSRIGNWNKIKPGKYEVKKGQRMISIARMLKNG